MVEITFAFSRTRGVTQMVSDEVFARVLHVLEAPEAYPLSMTLEEVRRAHIDRVVRASSSTVEAARALGMGYTTLWKHLKREASA